MGYTSDSVNAVLNESDSRITQEEGLIINARRLATLEQRALEEGKRHPTFWDRYNELRRQCGLPEVTPPTP